MRPAIHFGNSKEIWKQYSLGEITKIYDGTHQTPRYTTEGVMFLSVENIKTLKSNKFISEKDFDEEFKIRPEQGDILMTRIGDVGTANIVREEQKIAYYVSLALIKPNELDSNFLRWSIHSPSIQNEIWRRTLHIAFPKKINKNEIGKILITVPAVEEQIMIGKFFNRLDKRILIHQQELETLKQTKQGFLQKMFPKEGETVPEVRFDGFDEDWEVDSLENIAIYRRGSFPQPYGNKEWYDENKGMPFVQVIDVGNNLRLVNDTKQKISKIAQPKSVFVDSGKVLVTLQGSIGRVAVTQYPSYVDRTLLIFENYKIPMDQYYFAYSIQLLFNREKIKAPGGTIKTITKEALNSFLIFIPKIDEQTKIGEFFKQIDETINLYEKELEELKQTKQAFLQKMFV